MLDDHPFDDDDAYSHLQFWMRAAFFLCCPSVSSGIEGKMICIYDDDDPI
jgi:hypothetical protein